MGFAVSQITPPHGLGMLAAARRNVDEALSIDSNQRSAILTGRHGCQEKLFDLFTPYQEIAFHATNRALWLVGVGHSGIVGANLNPTSMFFLPLAFTFCLRL